MEWLNYHHLLYFWTVARAGSVTAAADELRLAQPTVSGQIRALEQALGDKLFVRVGRNLTLTEFGHTVYRYADEIFSVGRELLDVVKGRPTVQHTRFNVGVADVVPKLVAYQLLAPALALEPPVAIVCREGKSEPLIADLSIHTLDLVVSDAPIPPTVSVRAYNHLLGECGVTFFANEKIAAQLKGRFPASIDRAPMLVPTRNTSLRRDLEQWFAKVGVRPRFVSEFEDSALLKVFGEAGAGIFPAPSAIEKAVTRQYGVKKVGQTEEIRERFYAISVERKLKHPALVAISEAAREGLFR
jgi:LysR family transcriptional activator of nhaA